MVSLVEFPYKVIELVIKDVLEDPEYYEPATKPQEQSTTLDSPEK